MMMMYTLTATVSPEDLCMAVATVLKAPYETLLMSWYLLSNAMPLFCNNIFLARINACSLSQIHFSQY